MSVPELRSEVMLRNEETGGHVSVIENVVAPRAKGPYLHTHDFDETFYMLEGELVFQVEDQLMTKRRGEVAFAPPPACRRARSVRGVGALRHRLRGVAASSASSPVWPPSRLVRSRPSGRFSRSPTSLRFFRRAPVAWRDTGRAMSQESVERTERAVAAINETYRTGDLGPWRRYVEETYDPGIVLDATGGAFTEGEWRGHDGVVGFVANQMDVLDDMWLRVDDHIHDTDDCVVVAITFGGRARHSGLEVTLHPVHVFRLRDGKAVHWGIFQEREQALEAVGLRE